MNRLADVELQLIMHGLSALEILTLAQCSRHLFHATDSPFAWKYARLRLGTKPGPTSLLRNIFGWCRRMLGHGPIPTTHLLLHAKATVRWMQQDDGDGGGRQPTILSIASRTTIHELEVSRDTWNYRDHVSLVLSSSCMQQLRVLSFQTDATFWCSNIHPTIQEAIVQLPHLHTLRLSPGESNLVFLSRMPALTALHIQNTFDTFDTLQSSTWITHVAECSKLADLSVYRPFRRRPSDWSSFFGRPNILQLRSLKLDKLYFDAGIFTQLDLTAVFSRMCNLHALHLARCVCINTMLPALAHAPMLRQLIIEPDLMQAYERKYHTINTTVPLPLTLVNLLNAAPQLHCVLALTCDEEDMFYHEWMADGRQLQRKFEAEASLSAPRFTIQSNF